MSLAAKDDVAGNGNQPIGFSGLVNSFATLVANGATILRLPGPDGAAATLAAVAVPQAAIVVAAITESMGPVESAIAAIASKLANGGALLLDIENNQSLRQLHIVLEGRFGSFDPVGSIEDPSQVLSLKRVLAAVRGAGLHVVDVVRVQATAPDVGPAFAVAALKQGLQPLDWLNGPPPDRFWLSCTKQPQLSGSVLIGAGEVALQARTEALVRAFLPPDWEVICCAGQCEPVGFDRAIVQSKGDLVWFLRAGAMASRELFAEMTLCSITGPSTPAHNGERVCPGDLSGLMLARNDVMLAGPITAAFVNTQIAYEEWNMRLEALALTLQPVEGEFHSPLAAVEAKDTFAAEAAAMLAHWAPLLEGKRAADPVSGVTKISVPQIAPSPASDREPRITLCMIARNEERFLGDCLAHAVDAVDEIVLVDTGSTDRTVEIAQSYGAKVIHEAWCDDFSAPRNTGLRAATGDWILVLDADEMLTPGSPAKIRELVRDARIAGYHLRFSNMFTGGKTVGVMMVRLFRNLPDIGYQNIIHEQVTPSLVAAANVRGLALSAADIEVEHYGYTDEVMNSRNKNERNERLFKKQLTLHPNDIYSLYKYGDFLRRVPGRRQDARDLLEQCFDLIVQGPPWLPRELPYASEVAALCALEFGCANQHKRAREIVDIALRRFVPTPNLHYLAAGLALAAGKNDAAIAHYRRCLTYRGQVLVVPIQDGITSYVSLAGIAQALLQKGDPVQARRLLERSIALAPDYEPCHLLLSNLQLQCGDLAAALRTLTDFLATHPDSAGCCQQTTLILHRLGHSSQARRMGARAVQLLRASAADHEALRMQQLLAAM